MNKLRVAGYAVGGLLVVGIALIAWNWPHLQARAEAGAGYGARIGCSCRYVQGRSLESCAGDMEPGMETVWLDDDPAERTVTASVPLMARRAARYRPGFGCVLE